MRQLGLGAILSYVGSLVSLLLGLFYTPWMIGVIGSDDYGLYTLAVSVISMFLVDLGLNTSLTRFLSNSYALHDDRGANEYLSAAYAVYAILAIVVGAIFLMLFFFLDFIYANLTAEQLEVFKGLYVVVACYSVISLAFMSQKSVLVANEKFIFLKSCDLLQKLTVAGLTIVCLLYGIGVFGLVAANALGNLLFVLIRQIGIKRLTNAAASVRHAEHGKMKEIVSFSIWVAISDMGSRSLWALTPSVLAIFSNTTAVAFFGLASQLESYVYTVSDAVSGLLMPKVSKTLVGRDDGDQLTALMVRVGRFQAVVVGAIVVLFACCGQLFIRLWMGEGYESLWLCTLLVISPELLSLPAIVGNLSLTVKGYVKQKSLATVVSVTVGLFSACALSGPFGALGACFAVGLSFMVSYCLLVFLLIRKMRVDIPRYLHGVYARWLVVVGLTCACCFLLRSFFIGGGWFQFIVWCGCGVAVYGASCWFIMMNGQEKDALKTLFNKRKVAN